MPLPFFKKPASTATVSRTDGRVIPPTVADHVQPDLGDYSAEYPEPLPSVAKIVPLLFWVGLIGGGLFLWQLSEEVTKTRDEIQKLSARATSLRANRDELSGKIKAVAGAASDLRALEQWVSLSEPMHAVIFECLKTASSKVQLTRLEVRRVTPGSPRYSLLMACQGTKPQFDGMSKQLTEALTKLGWTVTPTDSEDKSLNYDVVIAPATAAQDAKS